MLLNSLISYEVGTTSKVKGLWHWECVCSHPFIFSLFTAQCSCKGTPLCKWASLSILKVDISDKGQRKVPTIISRTFLHLAFCFGKGIAYSNEPHQHKGSQSPGNLHLSSIILCVGRQIIVKFIKNYCEL